MTGRPDRSLPKNWNNISGARGCTSQTCSFRDAYDDFLTLNAIPIGLTTQSISDINEMTRRLVIPYDVVSDEHLKFIKSLKLPTFEVDESIYVKRLTMIVEKSIIKHFFYPIFTPYKHVKDVLQWLREN